MKTVLKRAFTLVEIMIVVLIIGILVAIAVPNFIRARESSRTKACIANLRQIDGAKEQWAMTNNIAQDHPNAINVNNILVAGGFIKSNPVCPSGGAYSGNLLSQPPTCSTGGVHLLP